MAVGHWGGVNNKELQNLYNQIETLNGSTTYICEKIANNLAQRLLRWVKQDTPVGDYEEYSYTKDGEEIIGNEGREGGTLRKAWTVRAVHKDKDSYEIEIINPTKYAMYVEYGHRQEPGRFIPALGKSLTRSWVEGRFMLTNNTVRLQNRAPAIIKSMLVQEIERIMHGK